MRFNYQHILAGAKSYTKLEDKMVQFFSDPFIVTSTTDLNDELLEKARGSTQRRWSRMFRLSDCAVSLSKKKPVIASVRRFVRCAFSQGRM